MKIMRLKQNILFLSLTILIFSACKSDEFVNESENEPENDYINKIMALGASRVEGNRPEFESFRYELWRQLLENNWAFDFVGTQSDNSSYPTFNNQNFDTDHEGRSGWTSEDILDGIDEWITETETPDIVLFSSPGGNDALQSLPYVQIPININAIIDILQEANPNVTILIEQLAPGRSDIMTSELTSYFDQINQDVLSIALEQSTSDSQVIAINMYTGFTDLMLADEVHYNASGADFIATRYYNVLSSILD
mgnify:FL=1|jgi:lysophospholipase L1-like esterase